MPLVILHSVILPLFNFLNDSIETYSSLEQMIPGAYPMSQIRCLVSIVSGKQFPPSLQLTL